jgi:hypothetical protein
MTFVPITDAEINQDSPVTQILMTKYRDNINFSALPITTTVISTPVASVDFTGFNAAQYNSYEIELINVILVTDGASLAFRTSSNGGVTYDSGASDYSSALGIANRIGLTVNQGSAAGEDGASGNVRIYGPGLPKKTLIRFETTFLNASGELTGNQISAGRLSSAAVDAVQIFTSSGNIESGTIIFRGFK